jgi:hypothetical protein
MLRGTFGQVVSIVRNRIGLIFAISIWPVASALAQAPAPSWSDTKCARYKAGWAEALKRRGERGLSAEFRERHEAFIASGCTAKADVCPRSAEEFAMADVMTIVAMNAGTASTFLPFACPKR